MQITWFGHSAFRLDFGDKAVLIDPFFTGNPAFTTDRSAAVKGVTHILVTHGHGDHIGDTAAIAQETGAKVVTNYDLCMYLASQGVQNFDPMNTGGTVDAGGFQVSLVRADHSAGLVEAGVGISVLPTYALAAPRQGRITARQLDAPTVSRDIVIISRRGRSLPPATEDFIEYVKRTAVADVSALAEIGASAEERS